jgi:hypothetical protein
MNAPTPALNSTLAHERSAGMWWELPGLALAAVLLAMTPLLWPTVPPLADLPGHMGSFAVSLGESPLLERYFGFHWLLIGNMGVDLLLVPLGRWVGVEAGTKIVIIATAGITAAGMLWLAAEVHGRLPATAAFAVPLVYCFPFNYGFANYCLSMGLMLCGLALWLRLGRQKRLVLRAAVFILVSTVLWVVHAIGWVLLALCCGLAELQRQRVAGAPWASALGRAFIGALPTCAPVLVIATLAHHQAHGDGLRKFFDLHDLALWFVSILRDRWRAFDLASLAILIGLVAWASLQWRGLRMAQGLALPGFALLLLFVVAPSQINGSDYVNTRIAPYALALLVLAVDTGGAKPHLRRRLAAAAAAFMLVRLAATTASFALYDREWTRELAALEGIPRGSRVVNLTPSPPGASTWYSRRMEHLAAMAVVRNEAFVNCEWDIDGLQLLQVKVAEAGPFSRDPSQMFYMPGPNTTDDVTFKRRFEAIPREAFDYVWLIDVPTDQRPRDTKLQQVWSNDDSALYRIQHQ